MTVSNRKSPASILREFTGRVEMSAFIRRTGRLKHKKREMKISLFYFIVAARRRLFGSGLFLFGRLGIFVKRIQFFDRNDFFFDLGLAQHEVDDFFFKHRRTQSFYRLGVFR